MKPIVSFIFSARESATSSIVQLYFVDIGTTCNNITRSASRRYFALKLQNSFIQGNGLSAHLDFQLGFVDREMVLTKGLAVVVQL